MRMTSGERVTSSERTPMREGNCIIMPMKTLAHMKVSQHFRGMFYRNPPQ